VRSDLTCLVIEKITTNFALYNCTELYLIITTGINMGIRYWYSRRNSGDSELGEVKGSTGRTAGQQLVGYL